jgi:hypothetical protein
MNSGVGVILFEFIGVTDMIFTLLRSSRFFEQNYIYFVNFE